MRDPNVSLAWDPLDDLAEQVRAQLENAATHRALTAPATSRAMYACTKLGAVDQFGHLTAEGRALLDALRAGRPCHIPDQPLPPWLPGGKPAKPEPDEAEAGDEDAEAADGKARKGKGAKAKTAALTPQFRVRDASAAPTPAAPRPAAPRPAVVPAQGSLFD